MRRYIPKFHPAVAFAALVMLVLLLIWFFAFHVAGPFGGVPR